MRSLKGTFALLILTCIVLALPVFVHTAGARADFDIWANRATRLLEPAYYDINGTMIERIVSWKGVQGIGNMGIGNGDVNLMKPDYLKSALQAPGNDTAGNETNITDNIPTGNETNITGNNTAGNETNITGGIATGNETNLTGNNATANETPAPEDVLYGTETLLPNNTSAASVVTYGEPYSITINQPYPHILNENPVEPAVLYGKLIGLPLPDGRKVHMGIMSLGYEY